MTSQQSIVTPRPGASSAGADPGGSPRVPAMVPAMALALSASFGSVAQWRHDLLDRGQTGAQADTEANPHAAAPTALALVFRPRDGRLQHQPVGDPAQADGLPLLVLALPVTPAQLDNIDWAAVYARYQAAVHDAGAALGAEAQMIGARTVLDVRRAGVFDEATHVLPGAHWRDPATVDDWAQQLPREQAVLVYCVYGHEVGRVTALRLQAAGLDARYLIGGIDGWTSAGRPLSTKPKGETP